MSEPKTMTVRVGRERVVLKLGRIRWTGVHQATGLEVTVEHTPPRIVWEVELPVPPSEKWRATVGGYSKTGATPQRAVSAALVVRRDHYEAQLDGATRSIERCERALEQARKNARRRIAELKATLEALR